MATRLNPYSGSVGPDKNPGLIHAFALKNLLKKSSKIKPNVEPIMNKNNSL